MVVESNDRLDLLLMDEGAFGAEGRALATRLALERPGLKVLRMLPAASPAERGHEPLLQVPEPVLQKPFTPDALVGMVRAVLAVD